MVRVKAASSDLDRAPLWGQRSKTLTTSHSRLSTEDPAANQPEYAPGQQPDHQLHPVDSANKGNTCRCCDGTVNQNRATMDHVREKLSAVWTARAANSADWCTSMPAEQNATPMPTRSG
jgi:hypothetical protein